MQFSRRRGLQFLGAAAGVVLGQRLPSRARALPHRPGGSVPSTAEQYGGFVLLDWDEPIPAYVLPTRVSTPATCALPPGEVSRAVYESLDGAPIAARIGAPFYRVAVADALYRRDPALIFSDVSRGPVSVVQAYSFFDESKGDWVQPITLTALLAVPTPIPVRPVGRPEFGLARPIKIDYSPQPGLVVRYGAFSSIRWTERGVLYLLDVREQYRQIEIDKIVRSMQRV